MSKIIIVSEESDFDIIEEKDREFGHEKCEVIQEKFLILINGVPVNFSCYRNKDLLCEDSEETYSFGCYSKTEETIGIRMSDDDNHKLRDILILNQQKKEFEAEIPKSLFDQVVEIKKKMAHENSSYFSM